LRNFRVVAGIAVGGLASAYVTAFLRLLFGYSLGTDAIYSSFLNDLIQFPILFAALDWIPSSIALGLSVALVALAHRNQLPGRYSMLVGATVYALLCVSVVAIRSRDPWSGPVNVFGPYSQSWSSAEGPTILFVIAAAFLIGGVAGAWAYGKLAGRG
jgi:hypothetical protein